MANHPLYVVFISFFSGGRKRPALKAIWGIIHLIRAALIFLIKIQPNLIFLKQQILCKFVYFICILNVFCFLF